MIDLDRIRAPRRFAAHTIVPEDSLYGERVEPLAERCPERVVRRCGEQRRGRRRLLWGGSGLCNLWRCQLEVGRPRAHSPMGGERVALVEPVAAIERRARGLSPCRRKQNFPVQDLEGELHGYPWMVGRLPNLAAS